MSAEGLQLARDKMAQAGVAPAAIDVFSHYYRELESGATGIIGEDSIDPLLDPPTLESVDVDPVAAREALGRTAIIKLNGGLGTSMGMAKAKSLLPVRDGETFLDLIVRQVLSVREQYGVALPLILMDSFRTQDDTLAALATHPELEVPGLPLDFVQNLEPKLLVDGLVPVSWSADRSLEWCPPGHGDLYTAILVRRRADLLDRGLVVGLGTDGAASNNNLNLLGEMSLTARLHKVASLDPTVLPARQVVEMATLAGARVLGLEESIGSLSPGKEADLIVVELNQPHLTPMYDPVLASGLCRGGWDVRQVMVQGRWLMQGPAIIDLGWGYIKERARWWGRKINSDSNDFFQT